MLEEVKAELHIMRWLEKEDARMRLRANPSERNLRRAWKTATKQLKRARAEGLQRFFE